MKLKLIVAGAGALLLLGLGVGASAYAAGASVPFLTAAKPSPSPGAHRGAACTDFMNHLAANLGISQSKLGSALQKSADQTIDDAVQAGKLTAEQAAKLKQRIDSGSLCRFAPGPATGAGPAGASMVMVIIKAAAETLNLTPEQLMTDIRQGQTLSSLAHGMTEDQFRQALVAHLKTDLDALVAQKKITAAQESAFLQRAQTAPIPFWNGSPRVPGGGGTTGRQPVFGGFWSGYPPASPATGA